MQQANGRYTQPYRKLTVILPVVVQYTRTQFTLTEQLLAVYAQHLTAVLAACNPIDQHPWAWITTPLGFDEEERILSLLGEFLTTVRKAVECCEHLQEAAGITLTRTAHGLENAAYTLALLPNSGAPLIEDLLAPCQATANRQILAEFIGHVESFRRGFESLSASASNASSLLDAQTADRLSGALEYLRQWGLEGHSVAEIKELLKASTDTSKLLGEAHSSFRVLLNVMGCDAPVTLSSAGFLLETVRIVEAAPFERLHLRQPSFEDERTKPMLEAAQQEAALLKGAEASLGTEFDLSLCAGMQSPAQLLEYAAALGGASLWKRFFGRDYRKAIKAYRRIALSGKKAPIAHMSQALRTVAEYAQKRTQFDNHTTYREVLGMHFQGVHSPWADLHQLLVWYEQIFVTLPEHQAHAQPFRQLVFTARIERLKAIKVSLSSTEEHRAALDQVLMRVKEFTRSVPSQRSLMISGSFDEILNRLRKLTRDLTDVLLATDGAAIRDDVPLRDVPNILEAAGECRRAIAAVQAAADVPALIGAAYRGVETDIEPIKDTVRFAGSIASSLPQKAVQWLLCREYGTRLIRIFNRPKRVCADRPTLAKTPSRIRAKRGAAYEIRRSESCRLPMSVRPTLRSVAQIALPAQELKCVGGSLRAIQKVRALAWKSEISGTQYPPRPLSSWSVSRI